VVPGCDGLGVILKVNRSGGVWSGGCWGRLRTARFGPGAREQGAGEWVKVEEGFDGGGPGGVV
jgi:hypothetical protein